MFRAKFKNHWPLVLKKFLKVFAIYSHGGHLIYTNFRTSFQRMLHMKFGFGWPSGFREEDV